MIFLKNDYSQGAHAKVLEALVRTNMEPAVGYSEDPYCAAAADRIRSRFGCPDADVHFLTGGTQANLVCIAAFLRPWDAVIAPTDAHIYVHETGAIEASGHKIFPVETPDGKLTPADIEAVVLAHTNDVSDQMVHPKLVYVSNPTELGTLYSKAELTAISEMCRKHDLYLYVDGARLAVGLGCPANDLAPEDYPRLCDAFYLGGTKNGLMFGEAVVLVNDTLKPYFRYAMRQHGALLAKGRLMGVQFLALMEDDLWLEIGRREVELAQMLQNGLRAKGIPLRLESPTNQIFAILPNEQVDALAEHCVFTRWEPADETHHVVRFVTSFASTEADVQALLELL